MLSLLLLAAAPVAPSYAHIMDCLGTVYINDQARFRATGKLVNDDLWLNELSQKSLEAKQAEGIASDQYSKDMARAMDEAKGAPLDAAGEAACKAEFGYHLN